MAARSDFFEAKLIRQHKRMLAMAQAYNFISDKHQLGDIRRALLGAHANHVSYKMKRTENRDNSNIE